jgi:hypothetical protein
MMPRTRSEAIERVRGGRIGERLEHRLIHGNVIVPAGRLLVWLKLGC